MNSAAFEAVYHMDHGDGAVLANDPPIVPSTP